MSKASLKIENKKDVFLHSTEVENIFINEFMPAAPGDYVKLYLYGLMYAQNGMPMDIRAAGRYLGMTESEVKAGWQYWDRNGMVRISMQDDEISDIVYISQIEMIYSKKMRRQEQPAVEEKDERMQRIINDELKYLFNQYEEATGYTVSQKEIRKISDAITLYNISPDIFSYAIKYCTELEKYSIDYMFKVALRWTQEGCKDVSQVKENLDRYSRKNEHYAMVFREMGWTRLPNPADKALMDHWFNDLGCTIGEVLEACRASAGIREPSLKYVNKVLENRQSELGGIDTRAQSSIRKTDSTANENLAKVSKKVLREYYDFIRTEAESIQNAHIDEVCSKFEEMRSIFEFENKLNADMMSVTLETGGKARRETIKEQRRMLEEEKKQILIENGYSEDYLDLKYRCDICGDTGVTDDGRFCTCSRERSEEAYKWYQTIKK